MIFLFFTLLAKSSFFNVLATIFAVNFSADQAVSTLIPSAGITIKYEGTGRLSSSFATAKNVRAKFVVIKIIEFSKNYKNEFTAKCTQKLFRSNELSSIKYGYLDRIYQNYKAFEEGGFFGTEYEKYNVNRLFSDLVSNNGYIMDNTGTITNTLLEVKNENITSLETTIRNKLNNVNFDNENVKEHIVNEKLTSYYG